MLFNDSYLTDAGAALFARAAANFDPVDTTSGIIWTVARTSSYDTSSLTDTAMKALTAINDGGTYIHNTAGAVTTVTRTGTAGELHVFCELTNDNTGATAASYAYTLGIWAKVDGDQSDTLAIVARCGSGVMPSYINPPSVGHVIAFANLIIDINSNQLQNTTDTTITADWYASAGTVQDLQDQLTVLNNRAVTTHATTGATDGDDQSIYGIKTFKDSSVFLSTVSITGATNITGAVTISGDISPYSDSINDIGSLNYRWNTIYAKNIGAPTKRVNLYAENIGSNSYTVSEIYVDDIFGGYFHGISDGPVGVLGIRDNVQANDKYFPVVLASNFNSSTTAYTSETLYVSLNDTSDYSLMFNPSSGILYTRHIGESDKLIDQIMTHSTISQTYSFTDSSAFFYSEDDENSTSIICNGNIVPLNNQVFDYNNDQYITVPTYNIGAVGSEYLNIYAKNIHGVLPHQASISIEPPIGSITMIYITLQSSSTGVIHPATIIQSNVGDIVSIKVLAYLKIINLQYCTLESIYYYVEVLHLSQH